MLYLHICKTKISLNHFINFNAQFSTIFQRNLNYINNNGKYLWMQSIYQVSWSSILEILETLELAKLIKTKSES